MSKNTEKFYKLSNKRKYRAQAKAGPKNHKIYTTLAPMWFEGYWFIPVQSFT